MADEKETRQQVIRSLLARNEISTQDQLLALLEVESIRTSQATLSRDLREMGAFKGPKGIELSRTQSRCTLPPALVEALQIQMRSAQCADNLFIIKTVPGAAQSLARAFDKVDLHLVLGTVASEDTIFIATRNASHATELHRLIARHAPSR
jgi:transcriptional regulator of arginine metabolism